MRATWTHPGAIVESDTDGTLTVVHIFGRLHLEQNSEFARRVHTVAARNGSTGVIVDMSKCAVLFSPEEAAQAVRPVLDAVKETPRPIAIIVEPDELPRFNDFAGRISEGRAVRQIFTSYMDAQSWAVQKGVVWRAWTRSEGRG
jgi:hypothetical protein